MFFVYILFSKSIQKYYVGSTNDLNDRIRRHNSRESNYTKKGVPWDLVHTIQLFTRAQAMNLEKKIKKRGIKRFLESKIKVVYPRLRAGGSQVRNFSTQEVLVEKRTNRKTSSFYRKGIFKEILSSRWKRAR